MPHPAGVTLNDEKIQELIRIYKRAVSRITENINEATTFDKLRRAQLLAQIQEIVQQLGTDINSWADENMTAYYREGFLEAQHELKRLGIDIEETAVFSVIDQEAVMALVDEVKLGFAESMRGVVRGVQRLFREADKMEINAILAEGVITGETQRKIAREIKLMLQDTGVTSLVDKAGRRWELETYTNMLVRTKAVEARNRGLGNRMAQYGFDLVQVSNHNSDHPECAFWEGKILSYTGKTPTGTKLPGDYVVAGSFSQALAAGLFHPNCKHAINVFSPELAAKTKAYDNPYNVNRNVQF